MHFLTQHQRGQQAAWAHPPSGELHRARIFQGRPRELAVEVEIRVREIRVVPSKVTCERGYSHEHLVRQCLCRSRCYC